MHVYITTCLHICVHLKNEVQKEREEKPFDISKYDIDLKLGAYIYKAPAPMMSALVILGIAAIFSITDISLVGVAVSKRRAESSKLLAPIVTLLFAITLLLIFIFMG